MRLEGPLFAPVILRELLDILHCSTTGHRTIQTFIFSQAQDFCADNGKQPDLPGAVFTEARSGINDPGRQFCPDFQFVWTK
jgi:hypothetical protein